MYDAPDHMIDFQNNHRKNRRKSPNPDKNNTPKDIDTILKECQHLLKSSRSSLLSDKIQNNICKAKQYQVTHFKTKQASSSDTEDSTIPKKNYILKNNGRYIVDVSKNWNDSCSTRNFYWKPENHSNLCRIPYSNYSSKETRYVPQFVDSATQTYDFSCPCNPKFDIVPDKNDKVLYPTTKWNSPHSNINATSTNSLRMSQRKTTITSSTLKDFNKSVSKFPDLQVSQIAVHIVPSKDIYTQCNYRMENHYCSSFLSDNDDKNDKLLYHQSDFVDPKIEKRNYTERKKNYLDLNPITPKRLQSHCSYRGKNDLVKYYILPAESLSVLDGYYENPKNYCTKKYSVAEDYENYDHKLNLKKCHLEDLNYESFKLAPSRKISKENSTVVQLQSPSGNPSINSIDWKHSVHSYSELLKCSEEDEIGEVSKTNKLFSNDLLWNTEYNKVPSCDNLIPHSTVTQCKTKKICSSISSEMHEKNYPFYEKSERNQPLYENSEKNHGRYDNPEKNNFQYENPGKIQLQYENPAKETVGKSNVSNSTSKKREAEDFSVKLSKPVRRIPCAKKSGRAICFSIVNPQKVDSFKKFNKVRMEAGMNPHESRDNIKKRSYCDLCSKNPESLSGEDEKSWCKIPSSCSRSGRKFQDILYRVVVLN